MKRKRNDEDVGCGMRGSKDDVGRSSCASDCVLCVRVAKVHLVLCTFPLTLIFCRLAWRPHHVFDSLDPRLFSFVRHAPPHCSSK